MHPDTPPTDTLATFLGAEPALTAPLPDYTSPVNYVAGQSDKRIYRFNPPAGHTKIKKMQWWHVAVSNWKLANPVGTNADCAAEFDTSEQYISLITNSAVFKRFHEKRILDAAAVIDNKLKSVATKALTRIEADLDSNLILDHKEVRDTASVVLKSLGYGIAKAPAVNITNQNLAVASTDTLEEIRAKLAG